MARSKSIAVANGATSSFCSAPASKWMIYSAIALVGVMVVVLAVSIGMRCREAFAQSGAKLVLVYKDGCVWCERFLPTWDAFASKYGDQVTIVKYEATADAGAIAKDYQGHVFGYPTVLLVTDDGRIITFSGNRSEDGLRNFLNENNVKIVAAKKEGFYGEPRRVETGMDQYKKNVKEASESDAKDNAKRQKELSAGGGMSTQ